MIFEIFKKYPKNEKFLLHLVHPMSIVKKVSLGQSDHGYNNLNIATFVLKK